MTDTLGMIAQYIDKNKEGWKGVVSEVTYARVRKNYNKDFVCLEFNVRDTTMSRLLYDSMKMWINTQPDTSELPGVAPPGDLANHVRGADPFAVVGSSAVFQRFEAKLHGLHPPAL